MFRGTKTPVLDFLPTSESPKCVYHVYDRRCDGYRSYLAVAPPDLFISLPPEIIFLIHNQLSQSGKSSFGRTCSTLRILTLPRQYERVQLKMPKRPSTSLNLPATGSNLELFLRTILSNPLLADLVKTIEIDFDIGMHGSRSGRLPVPIWLTSFTSSEMRLAEEVITRVCSYPIWKGGRRMHWHSHPHYFNSFHQHLWTQPGFLEKKCWIWDDEVTLQDSPLWETFAPRSSIEPMKLQEQWTSALYEGRDHGLVGHNHGRADAVFALILALCSSLRHIKPEKVPRTNATHGKTYGMGADDNFVARVLRGAINSQRAALEVCGKTELGRWETRRRPEGFQEGILVDLRWIDDYNSDADGSYETAYGWGATLPAMKDMFKASVLQAATMEYSRAPTLAEVLRYESRLEAERAVFGTITQSHHEIQRLMLLTAEERQSTLLGRYAQTMLDRKLIREGGGDPDT